MGVRVWCISLALLLMAAAAPGMAAQGEPGGTAVPSTIKAESVSELAVRAAMLRLDIARKELATKERQVSEGLASQGMVDAAQLKVSEAALALARAKQAAAGTGAVTQRVTVEVKDATLEDALRSMFKDTDQSVVVQPAVAGIRPVNLSLKNVQLEDAIKVVTRLNGLSYEHLDNLWVVFPEEGVLTVGGVRVPVVGALPEVPGNLGMRVGDETLRSTPRIVREIGLAPGPVPGSPARVKFPGNETLVDLDVKDAPLSEVLAKLSAAVNAALAKEAEKAGDAWVYRDRVDITAHESLCNARVTARVYRWPAGQVLGMLIEQTGAVFTEEMDKPSSAEMEQWDREKVGKLVSTTRIYLVPKPMLEVTGPGVPGRGGVGSGGGGGPVSGLGGGGASE